MKHSLGHLDERFWSFLLHFSACGAERIHFPISPREKCRKKVENVTSLGRAKPDGQLSQIVARARSAPSARSVHNHFLNTGGSHTLVRGWFRDLQFNACEILKTLGVYRGRILICSKSAQWILYTGLMIHN
jgi:hypothetical protein